MLGDVAQDKHCFELSTLWMGEPHLEEKKLTQALGGLGNSCNLGGGHSVILLFIPKKIFIECLFFARH